jgi:hypothetical protein
MCRTGVLQRVVLLADRTGPRVSHTLRHHTLRSAVIFLRRTVTYPEVRIAALRNMKR